MASMFEETVVNGMTLRNRLVRSATWEGMCDDTGRPTDKLIHWYMDLAKGGVGLIVTGYAYVRPDGKQMPGQMGIHTDDFGHTFRQMTKTVHEAGGSIAVQLVHVGGQTKTAVAGQTPLAPSAVKVDQFPEKPMELTIDEIEELVKCFGRAAGRAKEWGFDGVQIHAAHGYLINQFLSPLTNRRKDAYGGNLENRSRFLMDVYDEIRTEVGPDYPVFMKLNARDNLPGGLEFEDAMIIAGLMGKKGMDGMEISAGTPASGDGSPVRQKIDSRQKEAYHRDLAGKIKRVVPCPVMVVGGIRSCNVAEEIIKDGDADYISMARPLIREPSLSNRWQRGDTRPATCISCNSCFLPGIKEGGIYCVVERKEGKSNVYEG